MNPRQPSGSSAEWMELITQCRQSFYGVGRKAEVFSDDQRYPESECRLKSDL